MMIIFRVNVSMHLLTISLAQKQIQCSFKMYKNSNMQTQNITAIIYYGK